ncbi:formate dehydrogenase subunit gamma [Oceanisphaera psychrotolerans]|uniref:NADH-quinone oxidoreductase subunit E n=1 Tax=Oceanisphaera psychrotolerans TaxID=1414654 RepID=A0A1J4QDI3_9GAMM|nr:formate dehydrogenase subunit gamma [Oceanisphaera psychrotolerans]OIN09118.1 formate dehydrogenase subunit gamma [Oceanisphaera psychrotolerans]
MDETQAGVLDTIEEIVGSIKHKPGALLPILHSIQDHFGYIPDAAIEVIATHLRSTAADVHGVISFYHYFRSQKPGRHVIEVCRAEACQAQGSREFERHVREKLNIDFDQTTPDQDISLKAVYCLGNCATGPSIRVGDKIKGRMNPAKFDRLVDELTTFKLELK